jgi:hypothetical protein
MDVSPDAVIVKFPVISQQELRLATSIELVIENEPWTTIPPPLAQGSPASVGLKGAGASLAAESVLAPLSAPASLSHMHGSKRVPSSLQTW